MGDESMRTREERQRENVRGKVARAAARIAPLFGALTVSLIAGCTAILELDRNQCVVDAECADLFPTATMVCIDKVCQQPACDTDQECKARGGPQFATSICSEAHQCVPGECVDNSQCSPGVCNVAQNRCVDRECQTTQECLNKAETTTVQCIDGFCVDDVWGCIGKPDDRMVVPGAKGTLKIPLLSSTTNEPVAGAAWKIIVCPPPAVDADCKTPVTDPNSITYDPTTGIATVPGIPYGIPFRVQIDEAALTFVRAGATVPEPLIVPMDFYTQKPVVGVTEIPPLKVVSRPGLETLVDAFKGVTDPNMPNGGPAVDRELANVYGFAFDCQGNPAGDVNISYFDVLNQKLVGPRVLYFENAVPHLTEQWTFPGGIFSTLNLPTAPISLQTALVLGKSRDATDLPVITKSRVIRGGYNLLLLKQRMSVIHVHPRKYY